MPRTSTVNIDSIVLSTESPVLDSREPSGRPEGFRVYGSSIQNKKLMTIRSKQPLFGNKSQAAPIIWWNGREVVENGIPATDYLSAVIGEVVDSGDDKVFTKPSNSLITYDDDIRVPGQDMSIRIHRGAYLGLPRAQQGPTPYTGTYISWRHKMTVDAMDLLSMRYVEYTGTFVVGEELIVNNNGTIIDNGLITFKSFAYNGEAGEEGEIGNFLTLYDRSATTFTYGPLTFTGKTSGAVCTAATNTRLRYKILTGTPQIGEALNLVHAGVTYTGATLVSYDPVNLILEISNVFDGIARSTYTTYETDIVGITSGAIFDFGNNRESISAGKLHRYTAYDSVEQFNQLTSVSAGRRFWTGRNDGTTDARYFEEGLAGADAGYSESGAFFPDTGDWELIELVHNIHNSGDNLGHAYRAFNTVAYRKYSNQIDLTNLNTNKMGLLTCIGQDGTGGATQVDFDTWVNELYYDKSLQRVYLSNSATYKASGKNIELQLPIKWNPYEVTFVANIGNLNAGQPVYLYVVDEKNWVNGVDVNSYENAADVNGIPVSFV